MSVIERRIAASPRAWRLDAERMYQAHVRVYRRIGTHDLATIGSTFQVSPREIGEIFGVSRQAVVQWGGRGIPPNRLAEVGRVADVARRLRRTFKRERIPELVRQANPGLEGFNVLQTLAHPDGTARVMDALARLNSYVTAP